VTLPDLTNAATQPTSAQLARSAIRRGQWSSHTSGLADGYVQGNVVILPESLAGDFLRYCQLNPKPCPLLAVGEPGHANLPTLGGDIDIRTDVPLRHIQQKRNVAMYRSNMATERSGAFHGPMVVSMRPFKAADAIRAVEITSRFSQVHGAPVHLGDPSQIGIGDLSEPDYGDAVEVLPDEIPVFWACGVTPQAAITQARPAFCITHAPGAMLITDLLNHHLATS
jgi:uncharacterized protein YcsI (UPF0317 family)